MDSVTARLSIGDFSRATHIAVKMLRTITYREPR